MNRVSVPNERYHTDYTSGRVDLATKKTRGTPPAVLALAAYGLLNNIGE